MDKQTLVAAVKQYLENEETTFVAQIDQFIKLAEEDIYRQVQIKDLRKNFTSAFTPSDPNLSLPSDYLSPYSFAVIDGVGAYSYLLQKDVPFIREAYPDPTSTGTPRYYAQFDDAVLIVGPTPASALSVELYYFYRPTSLADGGDSGTTWLSINAEQALLFGTLVQGYIFMKGDQDVIDKYKEQYVQALASLKLILEGRADKDTRRRPNRRIEV